MPGTINEISEISIKEYTTLGEPGLNFWYTYFCPS
jgi:hypothetical protein